MLPTAVENRKLLLSKFAPVVPFLVNYRFRVLFTSAVPAHLCRFQPVLTLLTLPLLTLPPATLPLRLLILALSSLGSSISTVTLVTVSHWTAQWVSPRYIRRREGVNAGRGIKTY